MCRLAVALQAGAVVYDGPSCELTPELLNSIYGAESSDLFLPSLDQFGISLRGIAAEPAQGGAPVRPAYQSAAAV